MLHLICLCGADLLRGWECEVAEEGGDDKADQERRQLKMEQQIERQSERIESLR